MRTKQAVVAEVMAGDPIVVRIDSSLEEADVRIRSIYLKSIPVVDGEGTLVGVIRDADLVAYRFARSQHPDERTAQDQATKNARPDHRRG